MKLYDAAIHYIEDNGYSIFPLSLGDKLPLNQWKKYQTEHATTEEVDSWFDKGAPRSDGSFEKEFNIALVTGAISGVVVVDCDNPEAVSFAEKNNLSSPIYVKTRRGKHFYFRHPNNGRRYRNKAGSRPGSDWYNCPGLDFRGDGGYVVAAPSISMGDEHKTVHEYEMVIPEGLELCDLPLWSGKHDDYVGVEHFMMVNDLHELDLSSSKMHEGSLDIKEQLEKKVAHLGRKLQSNVGDATDDWMIRYCGQIVRGGKTGQELWADVCEFYNTFFERAPGESERVTSNWLQAKIKSAILMDRRNHPEDYDTKGERITDVVPDIPTDQEYRPILCADYARILDTIGDEAYLVDPIIPERKIVQVVGYNGHGKSLFVAGMMNAMSAGAPNFGPYQIRRPAKVLYLDFDNPASTVLSRMSNFVKIFGSTKDMFNLWSPAIIPSDAGGEMNLLTPEGLEVLNKWLSIVKPEVVVIDTVRNGFGGLDEKDPQDWYKVNRVAKIIRDKFKATVVLVHHRNKPNEGGLGREAGSTAQLTDLDTQVIITQVYKDKLEAKIKAGLADEDCVVDRRGTYFTPFTYFAKKITDMKLSDTRIRTVTEISFGKVRQETDLHKRTYIAWTECLLTGQAGLLWIPSVRDDALAMSVAGMSVTDIAKELYVPAHTIEGWLKL